MGVGTTASTSYGSNLIDSVTSNATGVFDNITDKGTAGKARQLWAASTYITMTANQTPGTLVGSAFIEVVRP